MSFIFLSHSNQDDVTASAVRDWLATEGYKSIFLDHDGIVGGEAWEERLYTELRRCRAFVALVSPAWLASPWCVAEVNHAQALRKVVLPLRIVDIDPSLYARAAPPILRRVQSIDWSLGEEAKGRLREALIRAGLDPKKLFAWDGVRDPYPGLPAFDAADAPVYFGREQEITDLLSILDSCRAPERSRLIIVQGASGTGKSSLIRAGVLPRLERDPDRWLVVPPFRPHRQPFHELADAISESIGTPALPAPSDGPHDRNAWSRWIIEAAGELRRRKARLGATVLVTIDQLEEALRPGDGIGDDFLLCLRDALATADYRLVVLVALRADFAATLQSHAALREPSPNSADIIATRTFQLGPMPRSSFSIVIEGPATLVGLEFESGLTSQLVDDTRSNDALPLLAFVLRELWTRHGRSGLRITRDDYRRFGGLENAVGDRANSIFSELKASAAEIVSFRTALLGMADLSPDGGIVRRLLPWADVAPDARELIDAFAAARLLVVNQTGVEVAHEALFRRWKTLVDWIEAGRSDLRSRRRIEAAYGAWKAETAHKQSRLLPPGRPLQEALDLYRRSNTDLSTEVREFVLASRRAARGKRARQIAALIGAVAAVPAIAVLIWMGVVWRGVRSVEAEIENTFVHIPSGCFPMGSPTDEDGRFPDEGLVHEVCPKGFALGKFTVTRGQWARVMIHNAYPSSTNADDLSAEERDKLPVETVSWNEAHVFVRIMSFFGQHQYRLPTESEWERAARAGTQTVRYWGNSAKDGCPYENMPDRRIEGSLDAYVDVDCHNLFVRTAPVGSFKPNPFGLYDMLGNVQQWVEDCHTVNYDNAPLDGSAFTQKDCANRVIRGGSWERWPRYMRAAFRLKSAPGSRSRYAGFRLVRITDP